MKAVVIPVFLFCVAFFSPSASASVASFATTDQSITFTGLGGNAQGEGQSRVTWGTCVFDGTNTKCTVSANFTGVGGGTISLVVTYPGNGASPLTATSISAGNNLVSLSLTSGSFLVTLAQSSGATVIFYQQSNWNFTFANPTCTVTSPPCAVGTTG